MIAIKGMEMPKNCWDCPILCKENGQCKVSEKYIYGNDIPADCPLVEIVTCKDCEHWDKEWTPNVPDNKEYHYCPMVDCNTAEDFYCADVERRKQ